MSLDQLLKEESGLNNKPVVAYHVRKRDRFGGNILCHILTSIFLLGGGFSSNLLWKLDVYEFSMLYVPWW